MNGPDEWQENNNRYLSAALAWLRLRLVRLAGAVALQQPSGRSDEHGQPLDRITDEDLAQAAQTVARAAVVDPPPALVILGRRFGLSRFEQEILLLCAAMELDTRIPDLCARAQDHPQRPYPTFALAFVLFDDPSWDVMSQERPLRFWRLLDVDQPGAAPLTMGALRADERTMNYVKGLNQMDERLPPLLVPFDAPGDGEMPLAPSHQTIADAMERSVRQWTGAGQWPVVQLVGSDSVSKQQVARCVLSRLGWQGFRMPGELLPSAAGELETLSRLWHRESILLPLGLYLDAAGLDGGSQSTENRLPLDRFLARCGALMFVDTQEPRASLGLSALTFDIDKPLPVEQEAAWNEVLGELADGSPAVLAGQFNLHLPAIHRIAASVLSGDAAEGAASDLPTRLWTACRRRTRPRLGRLAQRIDAKARWKDLVLPDEPLRLLHEIASQVRQRSKVYDGWGFRRTMSRGFGISALFAGDSGTGKTMAAEVIANELCLDLYRIDLSAVVSKYIGETEKNLGRLFDAAEDGGVILFFDEADALFGKRSEVKDSHDRYANIEINYLLQRIEAFRGLAILATNMKSALDAAFMRRIRFIVPFPFPGLPERSRIWAAAFPAEDREHQQTGTPTEALDYEQLARLNLTGGSIHNVALNAAFLAAEAGVPVNMQFLLEAARTELRKLEKPVSGIG